MKFSVMEFVELLIKSDLSDDQVEHIREIFRQAERASDKQAPMTSVFDFLLMRRKVLLKNEWRKPWKPEPAAPKVSDPGMDKLSPAEKLFRSHQYYKAKWERERHLAMLQAAQKPKGPLN